MGLSRQEYWGGLPFPSPEGLPDPGIEPGTPALQAYSLLSEPPGKLEFNLTPKFCFRSPFWLCMSQCSWRWTAIWDASDLPLSFLLSLWRCQRNIFSIWLQRFSCKHLQITFGKDELSYNKGLCMGWRSSIYPIFFPYLCHSDLFSTDVTDLPLVNAICDPVHLKDNQTQQETLPHPHSYTNY